LTDVVWASLSNRMRCFPTIWSKEYIHRERKAIGRNLNTFPVCVKLKEAERAHEASHTLSVLLLCCCLTPNRDYLENPAVPKL